MAFTELAYLEDVRWGLLQSGRPVTHFCLVAPIEVIRERLAARGEPIDDPKWSWVHRRAHECCIAHATEAFAWHVQTTGRPASTVAADLARRLRGQVDDRRS